MWDLPGSGLELVSPALAGGFLTTVPPGKSGFKGFDRETNQLKGLKWDNRYEYTVKGQEYSSITIVMVIIIKDLQMMY